MTHMDVQTQMRNRLVDTLDDAGYREFVSKLTAHIGDNEVIEEGDFDGLLVATIDDLAANADSIELAQGGIIPMGTMRMVGGEGVECFVPLNDRIREGFVDELVAKMREPLDPSAGRLMIPVVMWTNDDRDTPKMIEETLCVLEVALGEYVATRKRTQTEEQHKAFSGQVTSHIERVARLIEAARKNA